MALVEVSLNGNSSVLSTKDGALNFCLDLMCLFLCSEGRVVHDAAVKVTGEANQ